ncbi:MAG: DUF11 domain-containing protein, partial [Chromatiales bacterium]|nr:DUF11 domain-containing protein [Chromatiales bacterium]
MERIAVFTRLNTDRLTHFLSLAGTLLCALPQVALAGLGASVTLQTGQPTSIRPSETTVLEITLSNNDDVQEIGGVNFSNSLPGSDSDRLKVAAAASYTCFDPTIPGAVAAQGTLTATPGTQAISLTGGVIPRRDATSMTDGSCTLLIPVTADTSNGAGTSYTYTILDGAISGDGGAVANIGDVSQSINVLGIAQPTISKSFSPNTVVLGGVDSVLTITVSNSNGIPIENFSITDNFPVLGGDAIIEVADPVSTTASCTAGGIAPGFGAITAGDVAITASGGTLAANGSCTLTVQVSARQTNGTYTTGSRANTIDAVSDFNSDIGIRAQANASANITVTSPLSVAKSFSPTALAGGQNGTMTITWSNAGDSPLTVQAFTDSPIDGFAADAPGLGLEVNGPVLVNCPGGTPGTFAATADNEGITQNSNTTIAAGGACTLTVPFSANTQASNTPITYTNAIPEGAVDVGDLAIVSRARSATILVADTLRVLKSRSTSNPRPGNPVQYQITVQNWSNADLNNVQIIDALDYGMTFLSGMIGANDYTPTLSGTGCSGLIVSNGTGAGSADFVIGTVPQRVNDSTPGACVVTFYAMTSTAATDGTATDNTLPAGSVSADNGTGISNGGSANTTNSPVDTDTLVLTKAFSPAGPLQEGTVTRLTLTLSNFSANPLNNVTVSDTLPISGSVQMQVANPAVADTTCGGTLTATPGGTSISLNGATVPARANVGIGAAGTCTLSVNVVGPAGVYNNTATAAGTETYADGTTHTLDPVSGSAAFTYTSILSASKGFSPGTVSSGGLSTANIRLSNSGSLPLNNVSVTDNLPAGMTLADPANAYTTCSGNTAVSANPGAGSISLTGATVAASGSCDLVFNVRAVGSADWVNTIPVGGIVAVGSGVINQTQVSGTLLFDPGAAITVAKVTNPSTLTFPGQVSRLTITIMNGPQDVSGLSLTDYFTADGTDSAAANGMIITSNPQASTTCPGGIVSVTPGGDRVTVSGASLVADAACTVAVNVTSTRTGGITNFIPPGAIVTNQGLSNTGQATTSLTTQTNLGVVKQFTPRVIEPGQRSRLRITLFNPSSQVATSLSVTDTLPAGVTVASGPNPFTTCSGATILVPAADQVQVSGGNLGAASGTTPASCYAEIDVTAGSEGVYINDIPAGGLTGTVGGIPSSNSQPTTDTLLAKAPLQINKAIDGFTADAGNPAGFTTGTASRLPGAPAPLTIRLSNPNNTDLTQASLTDSLPDGLTVALTPAAATTCAGGSVSAPASARSIGLTGATVPAGGACTVTVNVVSNIAGTYRNTIGANTVMTFEGITNAEATNADLLVSSPPTVGKQFAPPVIPPNGNARLTLFLGNDNDLAITLTSIFTDTLPTAPGTVTVAAIPNVASTCTGAVTANPGAGSISLAGGATIPADGCRIEVDVTAATVGTHTNSIPAGALSTNAGVNAEPASAPLIVSTDGFISGRVFQDNGVTPDGLFDSALDKALAGVTIELHSGADCSGAPVDTVATDAQGNYLFFGLPAGSYSVCEPVQPGGTSNRPPVAGTITPVLGSTGSPGTASNPTASSSQIANIVLNDDGTDGAVSGSAENNFPEIVLSGLSGTVFLDLNNNGLQNGADSAISGQLIELLDNADTVLATTTTDADGHYEFTDLQPGSYSIRQPTQPANTSNGQTIPGTVGNGGTTGSASALTALPSRIDGIVLPANTDSPNNNFAEIANNRSLSGKVFFDFDDSGTLEGNDYGIAGQTIDLSGTDTNGNGVIRQTTTAADGSYSFNDLPEGSYTVTQPTQPADTSNGQTLVGTTGGTATTPAIAPSAISTIDLTGANTVSANNDFAEIPDP